MQKGIVYLIGAGPGDPGLLTLRAKEILEAADVVVYDYLANPVFLDFCRADAELIYVGKKGGDHTLPQDKINDLLVEKAKAGLSIARLKGGDPYIFGRGAEEAEELLAAGASFEVVPGVTSAVAGPAYAGIPLTHRQYASSCSFITGHEDPAKEESVMNWEALARSASTLVFFMGMKNLPEIAKNLMGAGMDPEMPVAVVRWGTTPQHRSMVATLSTVAEEAARQGFSAPSLIVVGRVVTLKSTLDWFEKRPLLGRGIVVTRAREQASGLKKALADLGARVFEFPTIKILALPDYAEVDAAIDTLATYGWIVFTSVNGVKHFWNRLAAKGLDARALAGAKVAAIGPATAEALKERGIVADFVPEKYVAESVVEGLLALGIQGANVLIPRAREAREVLPEQLAEAGCAVTLLPVYATMLAEEDASAPPRRDAGVEALTEALKAGEVHCVTFASSSTVTNFFKLLDKDLLAASPTKVKLAAIGPVTAKTLESYGLAPDIQPESFTIPDLVAELVRAFGKN